MNPYREQMLADAGKMGLTTEEMAVIDAMTRLGDSGPSSSGDEAYVQDLLRRDKETAVTAWEGRYPGDPQFVHRYAHGAHVTDALGREAVDAHTGILSIFSGHGHPRVLIAMVRELASGVWAPSSTHRSPAVIRFKEAIIRSLTPPGQEQLKPEDPKSWRVIPASSGNVAGDDARAAADAVSFDDDFLGKLQVETLSLAEQALGGNTHTILFEDCYSGNGARGNADCGLGIWRGLGTEKQSPNRVFITPTTDAFERAIEAMPKGRKPILHVEQILGLGGFVKIPTDVLKHMVRRVHELGGLFIVDEVQTAPCRTGEGFWYWHSWAAGDPMLEPDMVVFAKGFGNGRPVAGVAIRKEINDKLVALQERGIPVKKWFDTFALTPSDAAAGEEVAEDARQRDLTRVSKEQGGDLRIKLRTVGAMYPDVVDIDNEDGGVTGAGLMSGLRLRSAALTAKALHAAPAKGVLFGAGGRERKDPENFRGAPNTLRIAPPPGAVDAKIIAELAGRTRDIIKSLSQMA